VTPEVTPEVAPEVLLARLVVGEMTRQPRSSKQRYRLTLQGDGGEEEAMSDALARLNPRLPAEALEDAFRKPTRPEVADLTGTPLHRSRRSDDSPCLVLSLAHFLTER
jgi:hypothetical protein